jgi:hypothetical protein
MATPNNDNPDYTKTAEELRECARNWYFANADTQQVLLRAAREIEDLRIRLARAEGTIIALSTNDHGQGYD